MCLAVPVRIKSINDDEAEVESGGITYRACIILTPDVRVGDFVLLHTGYAISVMDPEEAEETLKIFKDMETRPTDEY